MARSSGYVTLRFSWGASTQRTRPPQRSTRLASSVTCQPSRSAASKARRRCSARKLWGVWAHQKSERSGVSRTMPRSQSFSVSVAG